MFLGRTFQVLALSLKLSISPCVAVRQWLQIRGKGLVLRDAPKVPRHLDA